MSIAQSSPQVRSIRHTHWCWMASTIITRYGPQLGIDGLGLYIALARYANHRTGQCWPSLERLATETGTPLDRIETALDRLVTLGLIQIQERPGRSPLFTLLAVPEEHVATPTSLPVPDIARVSDEPDLKINIKLDLDLDVVQEEGGLDLDTPAPVEVPIVPLPQTPPSQRPDDGLTALHLSPELDVRLEHAAIAAFVQEGKRLLRDGGWVTRGDVDSRKLALWETWRREAAEVEERPCCRAAGCLHDRTTVEACPDCGEVLASGA